MSQKKAAIYTLEQGVPVRRSYAQLHDDVTAACQKLRGWGVGEGARVGIYARNSYHWLVHDLALILLRAIPVPFTDDFKDMVNAALVERYEISLLLISKDDAKSFSGKPGYVAYIDQESGDVQIIPRATAPADDQADHLTYVFSSGSAGGLKGLVISRKGTLATLPPMLEAVGFTAKDRLLLFLPMSNFQQRYLCYGAFLYDFDIILTDYVDLFTAMQGLNPTVLVAPPILYQMLHGDFLKLSRWKQTLYHRVGAVLCLLPLPAARRALARKIFPNFYGQFGSSMRLLITGMAPIQKSVGLFFRQMQLPLCEAYGMVEAGVIAYRPAGIRNIASVGRPLRDVEFFFRDDSEIVVKRPNPVALRYFQCSEGENERTFVGPNLIATGDMGKLDGDGNLILLGRKKALIVLDNGQKIHPETIETELNNFADVENSIVFGRRGSAQLRCVIALNTPGSKEAQARVRESVAAFRSAKKALPPMDIVFADAGFSRENGMLRPNMKIDRKQVEKAYC